MNNLNTMMRNDDRNEDKPAYSRVFVVCSKQLRVDDLRPAFERYGVIEDIHMPKDRMTGESKGIAYIKYNKTSSAAAAIEQLHLKMIENCNKPIKVMVASHKNDNNIANEDKYKRLFIKVHKEVTENDIRAHFSIFGQVDSVRIQRDKLTDESRGFAYVVYRTFLEAAKAFEECDRKYKPIFASPKDELKRNRNSFDGCYDGFHSGNSSMIKGGFGDHFNMPKENMVNKESILSFIHTESHNYDTVNVTCSPPISQKHIERLFNVIPGMMHLKYACDPQNGLCNAAIKYDSTKAASYAVERLNNFEFPSGELVFVKPEENPLSKAANNLTDIVNNFKNCIDTTNPNLLQLAEAIAQASSLIKAATVAKEKTESQSSFCNITLPSPQPMANSNSRVALRCFLLFKPHPPPVSVLQDAFCRFGDLIEISTFPNKTFGFAKYASIKSAQEAIKTMNGVTLCGIKLKVLEAHEKPNTEEMNNANDSESYNTEKKRMRYNDQDTD